jgi:hypothetical protein
MDSNTFFVLMALIGGPVLCILAILICGKDQTHNVKSFDEWSEEYVRNNIHKLNSKETK